MTTKAEIGVLNAACLAATKNNCNGWSRNSGRASLASWCKKMAWRSIWCGLLAASRNRFLEPLIPE
eukprot:4952526-Amphidinium_carterae.1